jgi:membrane-bound serine protease (ClpP class)
LLLVVGIGGIIFEAVTPGFGLPGAIGVIALVLLASGLFIATPVGTVDILLMIAALVLLLLELLVFPGFGIAGILGVAALVIAVVRIFPNDNQWAYVLGYTAIFGAVLLVGLFWFLPNSPLFKRFALTTRLDNQPGMTPLQGHNVASYDYLFGKQGVASSDLRPAGIATIEGERVDVVTEGDFIPNGTPIAVMRVDGNRVVVRKVQA